MASSAVFHEIRPRQKVKLGCFTVEPIHVNHSIPDALAFAIECPAGVVIHTGDFKVDYTPLSGDAVTDLSTIAEYGRKGVLALLSDSTNAERPGFTATEQTVAEGVARPVRQSAGQAPHHRGDLCLQHLPRAADHRPGHRVGPQGGRQRPQHGLQHRDGRSELGYLHVPDGVLIDIEEINKYPPEKVVLITTGSQGEPLSCAVPHGLRPATVKVKVGPDDFIIISARPIPGNEKTVTKVVNGLLAPGRRGDLREHVRHPCFGPRLPGRAEAYADPGAPAVLPAGAR